MNTNFIIGILFLLFWYLFSCYCLQIIAKRLGFHTIAWTAWVPIMNVSLLVKMSNHSRWFILVSIPGPNIIFLIHMMGDIAESLGKSRYAGYFAVVLPVFGIAYLALT